VPLSLCQAIVEVSCRSRRHCDGTVVKHLPVDMA